MQILNEEYDMARGVGGESPANILKHIGGIDFPASKEDIVEHARKGSGPDTEQVVDFLESIPEREYGGPQEILKEMSKNRNEGDQGEESKAA
jgi:hypothetical protein